MIDGYQLITEKLRLFTRKFYQNELLKGVILFLSLGFIYFLVTVFIESFFWLKPFARTTLFWLFILVELYLFFQLILKPILKIIGLQKGISLKESSKIIGNHFPDVQDKLLNILQLKESSIQSDLLIASISQKAKELQPVPFLKAIDFKKNKKQLQFAIIPLSIFGVIFFTGNSAVFTQSLNRVVNYSTAYQPPAPFTFLLENKSLKVLQGKTFTLNIKTQGSVLPDEVKIAYDNQEYYLQKKSANSFFYEFTDVLENINFYLLSNGLHSQKHALKVIETPTILTVSMDFKFPRYLKRQNETILNTGNYLIPEGTKVQWNVHTTATDSVSFLCNKKKNLFKVVSKNDFKYQKEILKTIAYKISSSNASLQNYEQLEFSLGVIKDAFPMIEVQSNIDSVSREPIQFSGQISDDYGLDKLQFVYYEADNPKNQISIDLKLSDPNLQTFNYYLKDLTTLRKGINYKFFFQIFDNDAVNGSKKSSSKVFEYQQKTRDEIDVILLKEQKKTLNSLERSIQQQRAQQRELQKIQQVIQQKKKVNWNDKKKVQSFLKRQEEYQKMMQRQTDQLQENLQENREKNLSLQEKKTVLQNRISELKKTDQQQKLINEIAKIAAKLNKEDFLKKAKELAQQNKQQERSLTRTLELVKRFYVEQKIMQLANRIEKLSNTQQKLSLQNKNSLIQQKEIQKEFNKAKEDLNTLLKDNEKLKEPLELPNTVQEASRASTALNNAAEQLSKNDQKKASKSQKSASQQLKLMSDALKQSLLKMEMNTLEENLDDLRKILENLVTFSFKQESLMNVFDEISTIHPSFGKLLKKQNQIKTYFEHIDDSLYVLSMRLPKISTKIQDDLSTAHYNLSQSLENFSENRFPNGISNQRYIMTATNNLADYLSGILNGIKNAKSLKMGKGNESGFSLPDIIKKQEKLSDKMKKGIEKGKQSKGENGDQKSGEKSKPNKGNGVSGEVFDKGTDKDALDGALYRIYKEQSLLRQELQEAFKKRSVGALNQSRGLNKVLKTMEALENQILEKGFNRQSLQKMQRLTHELLTLDIANLTQGEEGKRKASPNSSQTKPNKNKELKFKKLFYNQTEILNRQSLPLQQNYKKKVREYFSEPHKTKQ